VLCDRASERPGAPHGADTGATAPRLRPRRRPLRLRTRRTSSWRSPAAEGFARRRRSAPWSSARSYRVTYMRSAEDLFDGIAGHRRGTCRLAEDLDHAEVVEDRAFVRAQVLDGHHDDWHAVSAGLAQMTQEHFAISARQ